MLISMTGQGQATRPFESGLVSTEIRAVNNRFLKIATRLDDAALPLETEIESLVRQLIKRGSLTITISISGLPAASAVTIDVGVLETYLHDASLAACKAGWNGAIGDFFNLPGVLVKNTKPEAEQLSQEASSYQQSALRDCLMAAAADLQQMRIREGAAMAKQFEQTLADFDRLIQVIKDGSARQLSEYQAKLEGKVRRSLDMLGVQFEPSDIIREVTLFADRSDISEEIVRFISHTQQVRELLDSEESPGRKLEFLIQELHREVNTIGSKSYDSTIAATVVEIKAKIEQLRELVQNVE